ncbi:MAG: hypothetical protein KI788_21130, partial [Mameliella sp.]|nr:hypothetical protein [Mameliella sp.]
THLRETEKKSWHVIAQELGISSGEAARSRYRKARKQADLKESPGILEAAANLGLGDVLKIKGGWLKSADASLRFETPNESDDEGAGLDEYAERLKSALSALPASSPTLTPDAPKDVRARYILTDLHGGMATNMVVSGEDWDMEKMSARLKEATTRLALQSAPAHVAEIANLGDTFHANDSKKKTFHSGHILDMVREAFPTIALHVTLSVVEMIEILKTKHDHIIYRGVAGNHDVDQHHWLTIALMMRYRDDPQVTVNFDQSKLVVYEFGANMQAYIHGDNITFQRAVNQIAHQHAEIWGRTKFRYLDSGHVHHDRVETIGGMRCESHANLAPVDAAAHGFGYFGTASAKCILNHAERGEITRHIASFA